MEGGSITPPVSGEALAPYVQNVVVNPTVPTGDNPG
jgi:hypothetical protein